MDFKKNLNQLLRRPVTRKEFMQHVGILLLGVIGLGPLLRILSGSQHQTDVGGYGVTPFGE